MLPARGGSCGSTSLVCAFTLNCRRLLAYSHEATVRISRPPGRTTNWGCCAIFNIEGGTVMTQFTCSYETTLLEHCTVSSRSEKYAYPYWVPLDRGRETYKVSTFNRGTDLFRPALRTHKLQNRKFAISATDRKGKEKIVREITGVLTLVCLLICIPRDRAVCSSALAYNPDI